jgi:hypothetical protein
MNIEELEFIRDYSDNLDNFKEKFRDLMCSREFESDPNGTTESALWDLFSTFELIEDKFQLFKKHVDYKYSAVWKKTYPHMVDIRERDDEA